jgi:hypothetical protein
MKYDIKQFRYCKSNQTLYSDVKTLTTKKNRRKKFSKKKFVIINNKTKVKYAFVYVREYYNAYKFVTQCKLKKKIFVVIFKPGLNKEDRKDLSPVKHLKIYATSKRMVYKVCLPYKSIEIFTKYNFDTRIKKINMQDVYSKIGVKRYVDISVQNFIDSNISYGIFLIILKDKKLIKKSHYNALVTRGENSPTFLLKKKYTLEVFDNSFYYKMFFPLVRFCPISKMQLKNGTFNHIKYNFNYLSDLLL